MYYILPHLHNGWQVDQAILSEEDCVVVIHFRHDWGPTCMKMDEVLYIIAETKWKIRCFVNNYMVDFGEVPDFNKLAQLYDTCSTMFFFRSKYTMVDLGTGNNKINWTLEDKQNMDDLIETIYHDACKDQSLVASRKDYSTKYRY
ncbi:thioredoxin-like protein 4A isoform X1 [Rattus norvegicus]|uniref:thioredoxin-like protein 4A isoform X1 n=1 Tax=Rattus norvegicus TaxID=10116 RepID=UPI0003D0AB88|nr:thioredoxin-like protein 4A [Rattus norvegicus]